MVCMASFCAEKLGCYRVITHASFHTVVKSTSLLLFVLSQLQLACCRSSFWFSFGRFFFEVDGVVGTCACGVRGVVRDGGSDDATVT